MGTKQRNEENPKLQVQYGWWGKANMPWKARKKRRRAYFKDGRGPCLDIFLRPCGRRKIIPIQNNVYDKYGSHKKLFQPRTLSRQFFSHLIYLCFSIAKISVSKSDSKPIVSEVSEHLFKVQIPEQHITFTKFGGGAQNHSLYITS